jgi:tetratricopeptide (TPR) repeat protein
LREADNLTLEIEERARARGERPDSIERVIRLGFADGWLRGDTQRAIARLDSAVRASAPGAIRGDTYFELATVYAMAGAPARARAMLEQADARMRDSAVQRRTRSRRLEVEADIALAERRTEDAIRGYRQSDVAGDGLPQGCSFCVPLFLGLAYDQANNADSAIANLERYLATPSSGRINLDEWLLAPTHKRLGELYEARGDNARAVSHYTKFVNLWQRADPDLQPKVAEVRARMERLLRTLPR